MNPYKVLNIQKNASQSEIKKSFRKLALQYHPDKNQDDKDAEKKFKKINAAYEILSDPSKKAVYDQFGTVDPQRHGHQQRGFNDIFEHFGDIFGGFGGDFFRSQRESAKTRREPGNGDAVTQLKVELDAVVFGDNKDIKVSRHIACKSCRGTGHPADRGPTECPTCKGAGQIIMSHAFVRMAQTCNTCQGIGQVIMHPCKKCKGEGIIRIVETISITIPRGVENGTRLRVSGKGDHVNLALPPGNAYVIISLKEHPIYHREGHNLFSEMDIPFKTAVLGGEIKVRTIWGIEPVYIEPGIQCNSTLVIERKGLPKINSHKIGKFHVTIGIDVPASLTAAQKELIEKLDG
jgi:molecular chaperone DnaJ